MVDLDQVHSFLELYRQLRKLFPEQLLEQDVLKLKVVYLDADGDWVMAVPDLRWQSFVEVARRQLMVGISVSILYGLKLNEAAA
eukprot:gene8441-8625_t